MSARQTSMNIDIVSPLNRFNLGGGTKVTALHYEDEKLFIGLATGGIQIMKLSDTVGSMKSPTRSLRSFRSLTDVKGLFQDNDQSKWYNQERAFDSVTPSSSPITTLLLIPLYKNGSRDVLLIGNSDVLRLFEWVGSHLNLIHSFDEAKSYSAFKYIETASLRLFLVGARKRLYIYSIRQKSRNVFDFELIKEVHLKDRVRAISHNQHPNIAVIAMTNSFAQVKLSGEFLTSELQVSEPSIPQSFSYFGLSTSSPHVEIVDVHDSSSVFIRDLQTGILRPQKGGFGFEASKLRLKTAPLKTVFLSPCYLLILVPKKIQIYEIASGDLLQTFNHNLNTSKIAISVFRNMVVIGTGSHVFQFRVATIQKQLDQYLSIRGSGSFMRGVNPKNDLRIIGLDKAISLVSSLDKDNEIFVRAEDVGPPTEKNKLLFLRNLFKEKAFALFELYSIYHESLVDIGSEWILFIGDIFSLFPEFIDGAKQIDNFETNGSLDEESIILGKEKFGSHMRNSIRRITLDDIKSLRALINDDQIQSEAEHESKKDTYGGQLSRATSTQSLLFGGGDEKISQTMRRFHKAVNNLIIYLTEQRRINASFLNSSDVQPFLMWKEVEVHPEDMYPDIDGQNERKYLAQSSSVIDTSLFLCYYYTKPMLLGPLLRLPSNKCDSRVVTKTLLDDLHEHNKESMRYIRELLDFYYGRGLHEEALKTLYDLAHEKTGEQRNDDNKVQGPDLSIEYLQKLGNENLDLICKSATWILAEDPSKMIERASLIFMNDSFECENYDTLEIFEYLKNSMRNDDLAIRYLEWLLEESDALDSPDRQRQKAMLSTKLCLFYLKKLKELDVSDEEFFHDRNYSKLDSFLKTSTSYEPWTVLRNIPTSYDKFLRLTISIYKRLKEHQKSVDILYNQLDDLNAAIDYCADLFSSPEEVSVGQDLLHKLLEDLLMHYQENRESVAHLLNTQGRRMSMMKVLMALPSNFSIKSISPFLQDKLTTADNENVDKRMKSQLLKLTYTKLRQELLERQSGYYKIESKNDTCKICGDRLGSSILCVDQKNRIVHYKCYQKEHG